MAFRDRIVELRRIRASELVPHPKNWRTHPKHQREALRAMLAEVGVADAVLVRRDDDGRFHLVDGHLRTETLGDAEVPALVLDVTADEADKILLTLDPIASMAGADTDRVSSLLQSVQTDSEAVQDLLRRVASSAHVDMRPKTPDEIDDVSGLSEPDKLQQKWQTAPGQLWRIRGNKTNHLLVCGSSLNPSTVSRVVADGLCDMMWTDPPYGVAYVGKGRDALELENDRLEPGELKRFLAECFIVAQSALRPGSAWYVAHPAGPLSHQFRLAVEDAGLMFRQGLVWVKDSMVLGRSDYHYIHEPIMFGYTSGDGRRGRGSSGWFGTNAEVSVFTVARPKANRLHPTMKPVELVARMIANSSRPNGRVYEPFSGSGTTILASETLGRSCSAVELDPRYVAVALERMSLMGGTATLEQGDDQKQR